MYFKLSNQNIYRVGVDVFGDYIVEHGFNYNKIYRYWYRPMPEVIQFLSLRRYSAGEYDISFLCVPYFIPLSLSLIDEKRGEVPSYFEGFQAGVMLSKMIDLGICNPDKIPYFALDPNKLTTEQTKAKMVSTFNVVVKPILEHATNVKGCYDSYMLLHSITLEEIKLTLTSPDLTMQNKDDFYEYNTRMSSFTEVMCLLNMKEYDKALRRMEEDATARKKHGATLYPLKQLKDLCNKEDMNGINHFMDQVKAENKRGLIECGFILSNT